MPRSEFAVHLLNPIGVEKAKAIGDLYHTFLSTLEQIAGTDGREMAIVRTKLEESCFFAKKAMAVLPENQRPDADV